MQPKTFNKPKHHFVLFALFVITIVFLTRCHADVNTTGVSKNNPYGKLSTDFVTPHIAWLRPSAGKTVRALVMAPTGQLIA